MPEKQRDVCVGRKMQSAHRMVKMAVQRGRSKVRDAKNNEVHDVQNNARQVCERARVGERSVS